MTLSSSSSFPPPSAVVSEWTKWVEETLFHLKSRGLIRDVKPLSTRDLFLGEEDHDKDDNKRRANRRIDDYMSKINNDDEPMASFDPVRARVDEETYEEIIKSNRRNVPYLFVRGDAVTLISPHEIRS